MRQGGLAGDDANAGVIASSTGRASDTPSPRSTVRRERCLFMRLSECAEDRALDDAQDQIRETVICFGGRLGDARGCCAVLGIEPAAQREGEQLFSEAARKRIRMPGQNGGE